MTENGQYSVAFQKEYILKFQPHCDKYLTPLASPKDKNVLVVGCGFGTEMYWSIKAGAKKVIGLDTVDRDMSALHSVVKETGVNPHNCQYQMIHLPVEDSDALDEQFDLVLSNNVFEHIEDICGALSACKKRINRNGRIAIFCDPLFYSSTGSHLNLEPWEHLWGDNDKIKAATDPFLWQHFKELNQMTVTGFLKAVETAGLTILQLGIVPDRNLDRFSDYVHKIPGDMSVTDLTTEGIYVILADYT